MVRLVLTLSRVAKIAAGTALAGGLLAIYGKVQGVAWASAAGTGLLFLGALVYLFERVRGLRKR